MYTNIGHEYVEYCIGNNMNHYGVKGMKWGIRRTPAQLHHDRYFRKSNGGHYSSKDVVFLSGKVKFDRPIPPIVKKELDKAMSSRSKIIIGDAPGADTRCQNYMKQKKYNNVTVYTTDDTVRNNIGGWPVKKISGHGETNERLIRRQKDIEMSNRATKGIVISSDDDRLGSATSLNVQRLIDNNKSVQFYDYKKDGLFTNNTIDNNKNTLTHYGVLGMKWGHHKLSDRIRDYRSRRKLKKIKKLKVSNKQKDIDKMTPEEREELRKSIKNSNDPSKVYTYRRLFNDTEIKAFATRFENEKKIKGMIPAKKSKGKKIIERVMKTQKTIGDVATAAENIKKNMDRINKILPDEPPKKKVTQPKLKPKPLNTKSNTDTLDEFLRNLELDPDYYKEVR